MISEIVNHVMLDIINKENNAFYVLMSVKHALQILCVQVVYLDINSLETHVWKNAHILVMDAQTLIQINVRVVMEDIFYREHHALKIYLAIIILIVLYAQEIII